MLNLAIFGRIGPRLRLDQPASLVHHDSSFIPHLTLLHAMSVFQK